MRIQLAVLRIIIFVVLVRTCSFAEAQKIVKRVVIHSSSGGLGSGVSTRVVIKRKGDKFLSNTRVMAIDTTSGGLKTRVLKPKGDKSLDKDRPVSVALVQSLVDALSAAPMTRPDLKNLGITKEWLAAKVESQQPRNIPQSQMTASQKKLFQESFTNLNLVENLLFNLLMPEILFDYSAFCKVEIFFDDGSKLSAESYSYAVFMLPWSMNGRRDAYNYNADISRAIAALLPESPNKTTLQADELDNDLAAVVMISIETEWNSLGPQ